MEYIQSIQKLAEEFKEEYPNLSDFESLMVAVQKQRNQILQEGLKVSSNDEYPSALETIAKQLGAEPQLSTTVIESLSEIADSLKSNKG